MLSTGGSLYGGPGIDVSGLKLTTKASTENSITITNLSAIPAFNRLPDLFTIYIYRNASESPIFYDISSSNVATPISPSGIYTVVYALNNNPITMGYSTNNGGSIYCSYLEGNSVPFIEADITIAFNNSQAPMKVSFYYFNS
jgi:hypothetical protein